MRVSIYKVARAEVVVVVISVVVVTIRQAVVVVVIVIVSTTIQHRIGRRYAPKTPTLAHLTPY